jgi:hypothetical protein
MLSIKITGYMVFSDGYGPVQSDLAAPTVVTFVTLSSNLIVYLSRSKPTVFSNHNYH